MFGYLKGLAEEGKLNKTLLDRAVKKGWITKEQEEEILRIAEDGREAGKGVNHDRTNNG